MRNKLAVLVFVALIHSGLKSQDFGFESWDNVQFSSTTQDPRGWASFNVLVIAGMPKTVFQETTAPFAGLSMARIVTANIPSGIQIPNPFQPGDLSTVGLLVTGTVGATFSPTLHVDVHYGKPYTWRSTSLTFQCKYSPVGSDSAFILAYLTKWNTSIPQHRDTIARGLFGTNAIATQSLKSLTMVYNPTFNNVYPDSQHVYISSSYYKGPGAPQVGSTLYIDDLKWLGWNGIDELNNNINAVTCYPNPATDAVYLRTNTPSATVDIIDISGRLIGTYGIKNNEVKINTEKYSTGLYFYRVTNDKKEVIGNGKFEVKK